MFVVLYESVNTAACNDFVLRAVIKKCNPEHLSWLGMLDRPLMLWVCFWYNSTTK